MFKLSQFITTYSSTDEGKIYLHSTSTNERTLISEKDYILLIDKCFHLIDKKLLCELMYKELVVPCLLNEEEMFFDYFENVSKLTIVLDENCLLDTIFENITTLLEKNIYKQLCILFIIKNEIQALSIKEFIKEHFKEVKDISFLLLEKLETTNFDFKINIYKFINEFKDIVLAYSHNIVDNKHKHEKNNSSLNDINISFIKTNYISNEFKDYITQPKNINTLSTLFSSHYYLKELPITGFIVDYHKLEGFMSHKDIDNQCFNCCFLTMCGGYFDGFNIICPSYKENIHLVKAEKKEDSSRLKIIGVRNSLTLKSEIQECFEEMIQQNVSNNEEYIFILYLVELYSKGFNYAKSAKFIEANKIFKKADNLVDKIIYSNVFIYNYIHTFITATKSYLAYKANKIEEATRMTLDGIRFGVELNKYISSDIISLHISQMLMNLSKIYLSSNDIEKWEETTLKNINYLINYVLPIEVEGFDINSLRKVPDRLRYFMLLEILNQELNFIMKNNFLRGIRLIQKIDMKNLSKDIDKQIFEWVNLINICHSSNFDVFDYKDRVSDFINSKNEIMDLSKLKIFLKYLLKNRAKNSSIISSLQF